MTRPDRLRRIARFAANILAASLLAGYVYALFQTDIRSNVILSVETYTDPTANQTLPQVFAERFQPASPDFRGGFDDSAHWFRIRLGYSGEAGGLMLEVSPPQLDDVRLYLPGDEPQSWVSHRNGDTVPLTQRDAQRVPISFAIPAALQGKIVYLRVQTETSTSLRLQADSIVHANQRSDRLLALHVIFFGLLGMGLLMAGLRIIERPSRLSFSLFAFMAVYIAFSMEGLGYGVVLFDDPVPDFHHETQIFAAMATVLFSIMFQRFYLQRHNPNRWALRATDAIIVVQALLFVPMALGHTKLAALGLVIFTLLFLVVLVALLATARIEDRTVWRALFPAYGVYIVVATLWMISRVGIVALPSASNHLIEILGLNTLFLALVLTLLDRRQVATAQRQTALTLAVAQSEQAAHERNSQIQDAFIAMLLHEVRNHLSVLQLSLHDLRDKGHRAEIEASIREMTAALAKAQHLAWLSQDTWPVKHQQVIMLEALDEVIERLGLVDRTTLQGDAAEAEISADAAMIDALLTHLLLATTAAAGHDAKVTITVSQSAPNMPCLLDITVTNAHGVEPKTKGPDAAHADPASDLDMAARLVAAMAGTLEVQSPQLGQRTLSVKLPALQNTPATSQPSVSKG